VAVAVCFVSRLVGMGICGGGVGGVWCSSGDSIGVVLVVVVVVMGGATGLGR
jgi:hypothetical protein